MGETVSQIEAKPLGVEERVVNVRAAAHAVEEAERGNGGGEEVGGVEKGVGGQVGRRGRVAEGFEAVKATVKAVGGGNGGVGAGRAEGARVENGRTGKGGGRRRRGKARRRRGSWRGRGRGRRR